MKKNWKTNKFCAGKTGTEGDAAVAKSAAAVKILPLPGLRPRIFCTPDKPLRAKCFYCGKEEITHMFCLEGHYVCDDCHRNSILDLVEQTCLQSDLADPLALLVEIFKLPNLHMHGPEYHSIVPAVLVTAYGNGMKKKDEAAVKEAVSRGRAIVGGICGTHGACGACIGVGIAYSIINKVTPYSTETREKQTG